MDMQLEATHEVTSRVGHANMWRVTEEEKAEMTAALRKAARANKRATAAAEKTRLELRELILKAAAGGIGSADITKAIEHRYDAAHVSRMIHGKA